MPIYVEHWGDNLQFYPNFPLFSTLGGDETRPKKRSSPKNEEFLYPNLSEDQKKRSSPKLKEFLSPKSRENKKNVQTLSSAQIQTLVKSLGGCSQIIGGIISPGFRHPCQYWHATNHYNNHFIYKNYAKRFQNYKKYVFGKTLCPC